VIGAHPDDADFLAGGLTALLTAQGHLVKFVSVSNGNMGHQSILPEELAPRRFQEATNAAHVVGAEFECLYENDGMIYVTPSAVGKVIRCIRKFNPEVIITHRPYDYHRDHRYTGQLVMDSSYMLMVPHYYPETLPQTRQLPFIFYGFDKFEQPSPFRPDVIVDIGETYDVKIQGLSCHESQMFEWMPWSVGIEHAVPPKEDHEKRAQLVEMMHDFLWSDAIKRYRAQISTLFDEPRSNRYEMYELCEYGRQPSRKELKTLFPHSAVVKW
jgi:LmbE family N-acetylglucosaminyl deacetylase